MRVRVVLPVTAPELLDRVRAELAAGAVAGVETDVVAIGAGPASIECEYDEALALPGVLQEVERAAAEGVDGVFVTCFGDPAVPAARELVGIPVVGGFEPAVLAAMSVSDRFGVVCVLPDVMPMIRALVRRHGLADRFAGIRSVDIPVLDLEGEDELARALLDQATALVERDGAESIVLGCTGMLGVAAALGDALLAKGLPVPVVDPTRTALAWLRMQHDLGLGSSGVTYVRRARR
ncbi:aspartate/glutamate racemase family protein [Umezawaea sp. Da 62-37]|uniref:aspartate/glutamate racemase family protein n=1 Tax=Umezawaea sp. Da 62-37 TaxID=3075927 RepID=UPI0028F6E0A5|nr:aspartate/glutamate racemase family protein [Umezawaea sp. Da 62-37]WNV87952.1 aspartate/glutamate racemase family protein [Umezawaea sp. Da 62-37]